MSYGRAKKASGGGTKVVKDNAERWLLTYADLITLLFVLFVVLYALSNRDLIKTVVLARSLNKAFSTEVLPSAITDLTESAASSGDNLMEKLQDDNAGSIDDRKLATIIDSITVQAGTHEEINTSYSSEGLVISVQGSLLFPSGRAELRPEADQTLGGLAKLLVSLPYDIRVEGHTDDIAPNSQIYENNMQLSIGRAYAVWRFLSTNGLGKERLSAAGFGDTRPREANSSAAKRALNRRVDIVILTQQVKRDLPPPRLGR